MFRGPRGRQAPAHRHVLVTQAGEGRRRARNRENRRRLRILSVLVSARPKALSEALVDRRRSWTKRAPPRCAGLQIASSLSMAYPIGVVVRGV